MVGEMDQRAAAQQAQPCAWGTAPSVLTALPVFPEPLSICLVQVMPGPASPLQVPSLSGVLLPGALSPPNAAQDTASYLLPADCPVGGPMGG